VTDADPSSAFNTLAGSYDEAFSESVLGKTLRERVWRRLDSAFRAGDRVLDIGCGTGEDALHMAGRGIFVVATDASSKMTELTRQKIERAGLAQRVDVRTVAAEALGRELADQRFDGVVSNFGVLNCVEDLGALARDLAPRVVPRGRAFLCLMGPVVPWEWGWYLLEGDWKKAFRRLMPGGADWRGMRIRYPTVGDVSKAFEPEFRARSARALGALLPPSYAEGWAKSHPELVGRLAELEERFEAIPPLAWFSDHYLLELVRT
jgi:SAM-dependent methyltransferase